MTKVIICSAAEIDYTESLMWYAEKSEDVAKAFDDEFGRALAEIANTPKRFPFCDEQHQFYLMSRFPFSIIYRMTTDEILVAAVAHGSRQPDYWENR